MAYVLLKATHPRLYDRPPTSSKRKLKISSRVMNEMRLHIIEIFEVFLEMISTNIHLP